MEESSDLLRLRAKIIDKYIILYKKNSKIANTNPFQEFKDFIRDGYENIGKIENFIDRDLSSVLKQSNIPEEKVPEKSFGELQVRNSSFEERHKHEMEKKHQAELKAKHEMEKKHQQHTNQYHPKK